MKKVFPRGFLWGVATSAHQVEGNNHNDWSEWERENAKKLREREGKRYPLSNYISGLSCDHYHLFEKDFEIIKSLGLNAYRFSIEWSRIEPEKGQFNQREIEHYQRMVANLNRRRIEPFVTLWHWTLPLWVKNLGGWRNRQTVEYFLDYVQNVVDRLKKEVVFWITLNEPMVYLSQSYLNGLWPPEKRNPFSALMALKNLISVHKKSYYLIKKKNPQSKIGIAQHYIYFEAYKEKPLNRLSKALLDYLWNFYFLNQIKKEQDFIGLNFYHHCRINYGLWRNENKLISDMGWELYPDGIYYALKDLQKYRRPIYITENGLADGQDRLRPDYLKKVLTNAHRALTEGVDLRGYFHWSLLDNFEWDKGFWPKFGLIEVDYPTLKRKMRPSAKIYAQIAQTNTLELSDEQKK